MMDGTCREKMEKVKVAEEARASETTKQSNRKRKKGARERDRER